MFRKRCFAPLVSSEIHWLRRLGTKPLLSGFSRSYQLVREERCKSLRGIVSVSYIKSIKAPFHEKEIGILNIQDIYLNY